MRSYFKPLRRKIGVLTLGLACLFAAGWVTSLQSTECLTVPITARFKLICVSRDSHCIVAAVSDLHEDDDMSGNVAPHVALQYLLGRPEQSLVRIKGNRFACYRNEISKYRFRGMVIPYWSIVIPLTLISAWLLLSRPRAPKPAPAAPEKSQ